MSLDQESEALQHMNLNKEVLQVRPQEHRGLLDHASNGANRHTCESLIVAKAAPLRQQMLKSRNPAQVLKALEPRNSNLTMRAHRSIPNHSFV